MTAALALRSTTTWTSRILAAIGIVCTATVAIGIVRAFIVTPAAGGHVFPPTGRGPDSLLFWRCAHRTWPPRLAGSATTARPSAVAEGLADDFVARYRAQIEPIGHAAAHANSFGVNTSWGTHKAVRVKLGAVTRPALVKQLRPQGAGPVAQGAAAGEFYEFVRWIDDDMTAMAGPLTDLAADQIRGLALGDLMQAQPTGRQ